jgi:hypothetical protein
MPQAYSHSLLAVATGRICRAADRIPYNADRIRNQHRALADFARISKERLLIMHQPDVVEVYGERTDWAGTAGAPSRKISTTWT